MSACAICMAVAVSVCAAARAEVISLDGTWQAEIAQDAQGDTIPAAFTRTIPVPGHWPLMKPSAPCGKKEALWCRTTWKAGLTNRRRMCYHTAHLLWETNDVER